MPNCGGGGNGSMSFYSTSANGHCGSVSSLRSGVSDHSQERKTCLKSLANVFSSFIVHTEAPEKVYRSC